MNNTLHNTSRFSIKLFLVMLIASVQGCSSDLTEISNIQAIQSDFNAKVPVARISGKVIDFFNDVKSKEFKILEDSTMVIYSKQTLDIPTSQSYIGAKFNSSPDNVFMDLGRIPKNSTAPKGGIKRTLLPRTGKIVGDIGTDTHTIDSILFASGDIELKAETTDLGASTVSITASIDEIKKDGKSTVITTTIGAKSSTSVTRKLDGATLANSKKARPNTIELAYIINAKITIPEGVKIGANPQLKITASINNGTHKIIFGDIKRKVVPLSKPKTIALDDLGKQFDKSFNHFNVTFTNPLFKIKAVNGYGVPFEIDLNNVHVTKSDGTFQDFTDKSTPPKEIALQQNAAKYENETLLPTEQTHIIDTTNSNIKDIFSEIPKSMHVQFSPILDPMDTRNNYIGQSSNFSAEVEMQIPLSGIWDASISKEFTQASSATDLKNIEFDYLTLEVDYTNEIPLDLELDMKDPSGNSLIKIPMKSAEEKNGIYITKKDAILIKMDGDKAKELLSVSKLKFDISLTSNNKAVIIKANQKFIMNWSVDAKFKEYKF